MLLAGSIVAVPAYAQGGGGTSGGGGISGGGGGTSGGGGGGGVPAPTPTPAPAPAPAPTSLSASLVGSATNPTATGTIRVVFSPKLALSGDVSNTGLPGGTWLDLVIDGKYIQSEQIQPFSGTAAFLVERLGGKLGNLLTPALQFLTTVHVGSSVVVRVSTTTTPLGVVGTVALSPLAGQVVATGTVH